MIECVCGSCNTDVVIRYPEYLYNGYVQQVEQKYTECWDCGLEFMTIEQINYNKSQIRMAQFTIDQWILDSVDE
jgi:hypothetical protein